MPSALLRAVAAVALSRPTLRGLRLLVRPQTVPRWHRSLITRHHATISRPRRRGRPRTLRSHERIHGTVGRNLPPGTPRPNPDLQPAPSPSRVLRALREYEAFYNTHRLTRASPIQDHSTRY